MKSAYSIFVLSFPVQIRDERTGETLEDSIVFTKDKLRAASEIGLDSEGLIFRAYNKLGYRVLNIEKPTRKEIAVDLTELFRLSQLTKPTIRPGASH